MNYIEKGCACYINGTQIINNGEERISEDEAKEYVKYIEEKYLRRISTIYIELDGDEVALHYKFVAMPFERIRRITGYLVGDMSSWNDAKKAEESDRVKHDVNMEVI